MRNRVQKRRLNPNDISLPSGYKIEVFYDELTTPLNVVFTENGGLTALIGYSLLIMEWIFVVVGQWLTLRMSFS